MTELLEEILPPTPEPTHKAQILRRPDGHLEVALLAWFVEDLPELPRTERYWVPVRTGVHLVDSLDAARHLAQELLRNHIPRA